MSTDKVKKPLSETKRKANNNYLNKLDDIKVRVPKGYRDIINSYATSKGTTTNQLIITLVNESMERDNFEGHIPTGISSINNKTEQ